MAESSGLERQLAAGVWQSCFGNAGGQKQMEARDCGGELCPCESLIEPDLSNSSSHASRVVPQGAVGEGLEGRKDGKHLAGQTAGETKNPNVVMALLRLDRNETM